MSSLTTAEGNLKSHLQLASLVDQLDTSQFSQQNLKILEDILNDLYFGTLAKQAEVGLIQNKLKLKRLKKALKDG